MEFGFGIPTRGPMATPESIATLARKGEELGFAIISVSDHVIIPKAIASTYPYNESGALSDGQRRPLTGTPQQIADDIKRYAEVGVRHMMVNLQGETLGQTLERMQRFADGVMPRTT